MRKKETKAHIISSAPENTLQRKYTRDVPDREIAWGK